MVLINREFPIRLHIHGFRRYFFGSFITLGMVTIPPHASIHPRLMNPYGGVTTTQDITAEPAATVQG